MSQTLFKACANVFCWVVCEDLGLDDGGGGGEGWDCNQGQGITMGFTVVGAVVIVCVGGSLVRKT